MTEYLRVSIKEIDLAEQRFKIGWPHQCKFETYLGSILLRTAGGFYYTADFAYEKIKLLNGPHWKAILKMHAIQYEQQAEAKWLNKRHHKK